MLEAKGSEGGRGRAAGNEHARILMVQPDNVKHITFTFSNRRELGSLGGTRQGRFGDKITLLVDVFATPPGIGVCGSKMGLKPVLISNRNASTAYGVDYITVGVHHLVYEELVKQARTKGMVVDTCEKVEKRGDYYAFNLNMRSVDQGGLVVGYQQEKGKNGKPDAFKVLDLGTVHDVLKSTRKSLMVCLIGNFRLKRHEAAHMINEAPWTMGATLSRIVVMREVEEKVAPRVDISHADVAEMLCKMSLGAISTLQPTAHANSDVDK